MVYLVTTGDYSDYGVVTIIKSDDLEKLMMAIEKYEGAAKEYLDGYSGTGPERPKLESFIEGLCEPVGYEEIHLDCHVTDWD